VRQGAYSVRTMSRQELDLAVDWAAAEGWNPGLHDANCFYAIDPNGFLIGLLETNRLPCCGLINTLASSGSVISVPVLLMLGLSLLEANATRRRFRRRLFGNSHRLCAPQSSARRFAGRPASVPALSHSYSPTCSSFRQPTAAASCVWRIRGNRPRC
jgi:hypothetical protein